MTRNYRLAKSIVTQADLNLCPDGAVDVLPSGNLKVAGEAITKAEQSRRLAAQARRRYAGKRRAS